MAKKFKIPSQYEYLLDQKIIDEKVIEKNKDLKHVFTFTPKEMNDRIRRNIAVISLHYADEHIRSKVPLFINAIVLTVKYTPVRESSKVCRFHAEILTPKFRRRDDFRAVPVNEFVALKLDHKDILSGKVYNSTDESFKMRGRIVLADDTVLAEEKMEVDVFKKLIDFVPNAISKAITSIQEGELDNIIVPKPSMGKLKRFHNALDSELEEFVKEYPDNKRLNKEQKTAVYVISRGLHKPNPFVLFGPPGTGKTVTIVSSVLQSLKEDENSRILICTPSNTAADRVAKELLKYFDGTLINNKNVLRLCSLSLDFDHRDRSLDCIANIGNDGYHLMSEFKEYRVIITTLATSVRLMGQRFTHIIVDEAGQALEAEIWIPLGCCGSKDTSVILCGDPKQLGPVNILNMPARFSGYLECPLNFYLKQLDYSIDPRLCVRLVDCFRCHGNIVKIASDLFYKCRLQNAGDQTWKGSLCQNPDWFNNDFPIIFINTINARQVKDPNGTSVGNRSEAKVVCQLLKYLNKKLNIDFENIGVVSPYKYHTKLIREKVLTIFNQKVLDKLTVDSVERFQGSEREVIIISTARTSGLGFLSCDLRLNTAITRAQRLLIVVGHRDNLQRHGNWKKFISYVDDNNAVYTGFPQVDLLSDSLLNLNITDNEN